jgi:CheY-like chemotaxis protein
MLRQNFSRGGKGIMSNPRILVVDDHKVMRTMIRKMLDPNKYDIVEAENGKLALDMLIADESIKLLICDVNMPVMDGLQLLDEKKKLEHHAETDVIIITSVRTDEMIQKVTEKGATAWITKPFKKEKLDEIMSLIVF